MTNETTKNLELWFEFDSYCPTIQKFLAENPDFLSKRDNGFVTQVADKFVDLFWGEELGLSFAGLRVGAEIVDDDGDLIILHAHVDGTSYISSEDLQKLLEEGKRRVAKFYGNTNEANDNGNIEKWSDIGGPWPRHLD